MNLRREPDFDQFLKCPLGVCDLGFAGGVRD